MSFEFICEADEGIMILPTMLFDFKEKSLYIGWIFWGLRIDF